MNIYAFDDTGRCIASAKFPNSSDAEDYAKLNNYAIYKLSHDDKEIDAIYYDGENIVDIPAATYMFSTFDYGTRSWKITNTALIVSERNRLLAQSDWSQLPDVAMSTKSQWIAYRQALRDLTAQPEYPANIVWPTPPQ